MEKTVSPWYNRSIPLEDEVTAMLDLITQAQIWELLLREGGRRGLGLLIVSHSRPLLQRLCTRVRCL